MTVFVGKAEWRTRVPSQMWGNEILEGGKQHVGNRDSREALARANVKGAPRDLPRWTRRASDLVEA